MRKYLDGLDADIRQSLLNQLRDLWTHSSTGIEGNSLTLGETSFVISEGLTVSGKPLKDHEEVVGHARAIDLLYGMLDRDITRNDLFELHKSIQTERVADIYKPHGDWKVEPNGTYAVDREGRQVFIEYAMPEDVGPLMDEVIEYTNRMNTRLSDLKDAVKTYARIHIGVAHIHPFWDGNGRIARLIANFPLLNSGLPPIVIKKESRRKYLQTLAQYQLETGRITSTTGTWPDDARMDPFVDFCRECYEATRQLVEQAMRQQRSRRS